MSVNVGRILDIPIRIHWTLWLVFILIAWSLATPGGYLSLTYPGLDSTTYWLIGIVSALLLFISVLLHELSHSYIAKKNGLPIARITLFFFGGVSEMTEEPRDPGLEIRMAASGPLTSFAIAGVMGALWLLARFVSAPLAIIATLRYGALINAVLGAFNLIPAFPLDGGRVLRGSIWKRSGNLLSATGSAARVSEGLSTLMIGVGLLLVVFTGNIVNGLWILFLGWFIRTGAETSLKRTRMTDILSRVSVSDIMTRQPLTVSPNITIHALVSDYFLTHPHGGYPVVQNDKVVGVVTMDSVRAIPGEKRDAEPVSQAMVPYEKAVTVTSTVSAADALQKMAQTGVGYVLVMDQDKLLGIVSRSDIMRTLRTRQELGI